MKTGSYATRELIARAVALAGCWLLARQASADTVNAHWNSATDVPVSSSAYTAAGNSINFSLNFAPGTGTDLMVISNTGLAFTAGTFQNLAQGQAVALSYGGVTYRFVANYFGGSGNDLVLAWADRRIFGWGSNSEGELGDGTEAASPLYGSLAPVAVDTTTSALAGRTVLALAAGACHSLALCADGTVAGWGNNDQGRLGDNTTTKHLLPVAVNTTPGLSALAGKTVAAISAGVDHSLALCSDGTVAAWGKNDRGQLGDNSTNTRLVPVAVNTTPGLSALAGRMVVAIQAGASFSLALCSDGTVAAWGYNSLGQLGDNATTNHLVPVLVNTTPGLSALSGRTVVAIAAGYAHSLALCSDGAVAAWGYNSYGQLGNGSTTTSRIPVGINGAAQGSALTGRTVVMLGAGMMHSLALCSDGTVAAWGENSYGELGDGTDVQRVLPIAVSTNAGASALAGRTPRLIAVGDEHSLALCSDGTVVGWGDNIVGQLGDGTTMNRYVPIAVTMSPFLPGQRVSHVASGPTAAHNFVLVSAPPATPVTLLANRTATDRSFTFAFTNSPGAFFTVLAATNPGLPLSSWTWVTGLTEASPGRFQFADAQASNYPARFYRVSSP